MFSTQYNYAGEFSGVKFDTKANISQGKNPISEFLHERLFVERRDKLENLFDPTMTSDEGTD